MDLETLSGVHWNITRHTTNVDLDRVRSITRRSGDGRFDAVFVIHSTAKSKSDVGTINITPDVENMLPSGIITPIVILRDGNSYVELY